MFFPVSSLTTAAQVSTAEAMGTQSTEPRLNNHTNILSIMSRFFYLCLPPCPLVHQPYQIYSTIDDSEIAAFNTCTLNCVCVVAYSFADRAKVYS